ncbi:MAG: mechanosensitive ion channel family protein, partial [Longimicrobiales bacterium]|nr:mechanosensitive ion channel family protein [Longimicrobiales bacterium]
MDRFVNGILDRLATIFDPEALGATAADVLANLVIALATFAAYYLIWMALDRIIKRVSGRMEADATNREFIRMVLKFAVLTLGTVSALAAIGVNTASVLASLGVAGLTVGFAAKDALSNMISGLLIYWDRPFVIGDLLEVGTHYGRVDRITLRSTRVITPDGRMLAVPNTEIINRTVASYTNFPHIRIDVPVTVAVDEDIGRVRALLLELVSGSDEYMDDPRPEVVVTQLNDYNVELELRAWAHDERRHQQLRPALREANYETHTRAAEDNPYETI